MDNQFFTARNPEIRLFAILAIVLSFLLVGSIIFSLKGEKGDNSRASETASKSFPQVKIGAKAVYVYDIRTKSVLFAKNENTRLPLASLTKIMSALVAKDSSPLYGTVRVTVEALNAEGDSGLYKDEQWSLQDLLDFSLITSSNDGIRAVALSLGALSKANATTEEIINDFVGEMNHRAGVLGLKDTYFWNETGLDLPPESGSSLIKGGAYGSAKDMSTLLEYILVDHSELFAATRVAQTTIKSIDNHQHIARNTNDITNEIPGLLASKTGFTDTAGGNLVFIFDPELGRPIIISILGSTEEGRFDDARVLISSVMEYLKNN